MSLDSIINAIIPFLILVFAFWIFRKPLGDMFNLISKIIKKFKGKGDDGEGDKSYYGTVQYE